MGGGVIGGIKGLGRGYRRYKGMGRGYRRYKVMGEGL